MAKGSWNGPGGGGIGGNATPDKIIAPYSAFVDGEEIIGIITEHGDVIFIPTSSDQSIPDGVYKDAVIKGAKIAAGNAAAAQVLTGYTFSNASDVGIAGAMVNRGALNITPSASAQTVQPGYYSGGTIAAIPSGTYKRVASGSLSISNGSGTVSGLAFRPSTVIILYNYQYDNPTLSTIGSQSANTIMQISMVAGGGGPGMNIYGAISITSTGFTVTNIGFLGSSLAYYAIE